MIANIEGCIELIAAVINPTTYTKSSGRKKTKKDDLPPVDDMWLDMAAGILDIDEEVIKQRSKK